MYFLKLDFNSSILSYSLYQAIVFNSFYEATVINLILLEVK